MCQCDNVTRGGGLYITTLSSMDGCEIYLLRGGDGVHNKHV